MWVQTALLFLIVIPCVITDIKSHTLSAVYLAGGILAGIISNVITKETDALMMTLGLLPGLLFFIAAFNRKRPVGFGDGLLVIAIGVTIGGEETFTVLLLALLSSGIAGLFVCLRYRKSLSTRMAFAPFLALGCVFERAVYIIADKGLLN